MKYKTKNDKRGHTGIYYAKHCNTKYEKYLNQRRRDLDALAKATYSEKATPVAEEEK